MWHGHLIISRSYHLIATCGKDHRLKGHRVKKRGRGGGGGKGGGGEEGATSQKTAASSSLVYEGTEDLDRS